MERKVAPTSPGSLVPQMEKYEAWLFDMDGVLTNTASVHAEAWRQAFDEFLTQETQRSGVPYAPFDPEADYEHYVDGEPRDDGVRKFLAARGVVLAEGAEGDTLASRTVKGVGDYKNDLVLRVMASQGVAPYDGALELVTALRARGVKVAVVSASENTKAALKAAGLVSLFDAIVDGNVLKSRGLAGKPAPDSYLEGARLLNTSPDKAVVLEDALAGVAAGRAGHFSLVIGVDHHDGAGESSYADQLRAHGADVVVSSLAQLIGGGHA